MKTIIAENPQRANTMPDSIWCGTRDLEGANCEEIYIEVNSEFTLRVLQWTPVDPSYSERDPIVMVPGWGSVFLGWKPLLSAWVKLRPIIYIETREKGGTKIGKNVKKSDFEIHKYAEDLAVVIDYFGLDTNSVDWFSASLGSTILLEGFRRGILTGRSSLMLAPNAEFNFPLWGRILLNIPAPIQFYSALRWIAVKAVTSRVSEEGQKIRYKRTLMAQDMNRLRSSARLNMDFKLNLDFSHIDFPIGLMAAESDHLHGMEAIEAIHNALPNSRLILVKSNQHIHEAEAIPEIEAFFSEAIA